MSNVQFISRELVKSILVSSKLICESHSNQISIIDCLPFLGLLIKEIIFELPEDKQSYFIEHVKKELLISGDEEIALNNEEYKTWSDGLNKFFQIKNEVCVLTKSLIIKLILCFDKRTVYKNDMIFFTLSNSVNYIKKLHNAVKPKDSLMFLLKINE